MAKKISSSMKLAYFFAFFVLVPFVLFFLGWIFNTIHNKVADLEVLIRFLIELFNPAFMIFVYAMSRLFVDKDKDGTPDVLESDGGESNV